MIENLTTKDKSTENAERQLEQAKVRLAEKNKKENEKGRSQPVRLFQGDRGCAHNKQEVPEGPRYTACQFVYDRESGASPSDAEKPKDERIKSGKYIKEKE